VLRSMLLYSAELLALAAICFALLRVQIPRVLQWAVVVYGVGAYLAVTVLDFPVSDQLGSVDLAHFWSAGRALWEGLSPYANSDTLNPPTAAPFLLFFGAVNLPVAAMIWIPLNAVGGLLLVPLAQWVLSVLAPGEWKLPAPLVGLFAVDVALSYANRSGMIGGQFSCLVALALMGAVVSQARRRQVSAGVFLAIATVKTGLMVPFLLLFHRRTDLRAVATLSVCCLALCFFAWPPTRIPHLCRECLNKIAAFSERGAENDYSYENRHKAYVDILGFDHLMYRMGMRDRMAIRIGQYAALLVLGAWVARQVLGPNPLSPAAGCSLVAIYSTVFLYHRLCDTIILSLPLMYAVGSALAETGKARIAFTLCTAAILGILSLRYRMLANLTDLYADSTSVEGRLIQALVLPYGTWLVMLAMGFLALAESWRRAGKKTKGEAADGKCGYVQIVLAAILVVGLVSRVGLAVVHGISSNPEQMSDEGEIDTYAWNLAQGNGYRGMSPDMPDRNHLTAYRPPGASLLAAGIYRLFGHRYDAVRLVHCLLGVGSIWLTFRVGRRLFGAAIGLTAAAILALYPMAVLQSTELMSEPLGVFLFLAFIDQTLQFAYAPTWRRSVFAGLMLGAALLTRANYAPMLPLLVFWLIWQFRSDWRRVLCGMAIPIAAVLCLAPWTMRNYQIFSEFVPLSTSGGSALLQGNNSIVVTDPKLFGYSVWDTRIPEFRDSLQNAGNEVERDRRARTFAIQWLKDNSDKWRFLLWHKFLRSWTPFLVDNPSTTHRWLYLLSWGPILVLFVVALGPTLAISLRFRHTVLLLHLAILHYVANSLIFFANIRYRAPIDPLCIIFAATIIARILYVVGWKRVGTPFATGNSSASSVKNLVTPVSNEVLKVH